MGVSENVMRLCITYTRIYAPVYLIIGLWASYSVVFQTSNYTKPLVAYGILRSVLNIILDYLLIFGKSGNIIIGSGIRGYGDTKWMFFTQALGTVGVVGLACLCVFVFKLGMLGVFIAVLCGEAIRAIINFIRSSRIKFLDFEKS